MSQHPSESNRTVGYYELDENAPITCLYCNQWFPNHYAFRVMTDHAKTCWVYTDTDPNWWDDSGMSTGIGSLDVWEDDGGNQQDDHQSGEALPETGPGVSGASPATESETG